MKVRILIVCLVLSLLANVAGLVFFIGYVKLLGHYKVSQRENRQMSQNLSLIRGQGIQGEAIDASGRILRCVFKSHFDGAQDAFALMTPELDLPTRDVTLVVYLHGMGSSYLEPFIFPEGKSIAQEVMERDSKVVLASLSYRGKASWASDAAVSDISQNIRELCQKFPVKSIVLMGTSMGGCMVLTYAARAPIDIKEKVAGVVSVESAGDMAKLFNETGEPVVKATMMDAFGGLPEQKPDSYKARSFLYVIDGLPRSVHVAVISATQDHIVPAGLQKEIVSALEARHIPVRLIEVDADHGCPPASYYSKGLEFAESGP